MLNYFISFILSYIFGYVCYKFLLSIKKNEKKLNKCIAFISSIIFFSLLLNLTKQDNIIQLLDVPLIKINKFGSLKDILISIEDF
jgi:hypothetical protein